MKLAQCLLFPLFNTVLLYSAQQQGLIRKVSQNEKAAQIITQAQYLAAATNHRFVPNTSPITEPIDCLAETEFVERISVPKIMFSNTTNTNYIAALTAGGEHLGITSSTSPYIILYDIERATNGSEHYVYSISTNGAVIALKRCCLHNVFFVVYAHYAKPDKLTIRADDVSFTETSMSLNIHSAFHLTLPLVATALSHNHIIQIYDINTGERLYTIPLQSLTMLNNKPVHWHPTNRTCMVVSNVSMHHQIPAQDISSIHNFTTLPCDISLVKDDKKPLVISNDNANQSLQRTFHSFIYSGKNSSILTTLNTYNNRQYRELIHRNSRNNMLSIIADNLLLYDFDPNSGTLFYNNLIHRPKKFILTSITRSSGFDRTLHEYLNNLTETSLPFVHTS